MNFAIPSDHGVKMKKGEKRNMFVDLARELKTLWNLKVMVKSVVTGELNTAKKILVKGLEELKIKERVESIKTTAVTSARIQRKVLVS